MRVAGVALLAVFLLAAAGCGGGGSAASNGEASKSPTTVLSDATKAARNAKSLHVTGAINSNGTPIKLDLTLANGTGATGSITENGLEFDLVRVGNTVYIRGSDAFLHKYAGAAAGLLKGKWLKGSATKGQLAQLIPLTTPGALFSAIGSHHGALKNDGETTYNGQKVVEIVDTSDNSKLYVASTGTPYPVAIVGGKKSESGAIDFGDWNKSVTVTAPKGAIDISAFGG